jgi:hypothetical protein
MSGRGRVWAGRNYSCDRRGRAENLNVRWGEPLPGSFNFQSEVDGMIAPMTSAAQWCDPPAGTPGALLLKAAMHCAAMCLAQTASTVIDSTDRFRDRCGDTPRSVKHPVEEDDDSACGCRATKLREGHNQFRCRGDFDSFAPLRNLGAGVTVHGQRRRRRHHRGHRCEAPVRRPPSSHGCGAHRIITGNRDHANHA